MEVADETWMHGCLVVDFNQIQTVLNFPNTRRKRKLGHGSCYESPKSNLEMQYLSLRFDLHFNEDLLLQRK